MKAILHSDGGARGNPGPAGIGAVLKISASSADKGDKEFLFKKYIGSTTNNQAEYQALLLGMHEAALAGVTELECYLDSELVVKQLKREYKVKDGGLAILFVKVWNQMNDFKKVSFHHIRREQNKLADQLVNEALDEHIKGKK